MVSWGKYIKIFLLIYFFVITLPMVFAQQFSQAKGSGIVKPVEPSNKTLAEPTPTWVINKSAGYIKSFVGDDYFNQHFTLRGNESLLSEGSILYRIFYLYDIPSEYLASPNPRHVFVTLDKDGNIIDYLGPKKPRAFSITKDQAVNEGKQNGLKEPITAEIDRVLASNSIDGYVWVVIGAIEQSSCRNIGGTQECLIPGIYVDVDDGSIQGKFTRSTLIREPGPRFAKRQQNYNIILALIVIGVVIPLLFYFLYKFYKKKPKNKIIGLILIALLSLIFFSATIQETFGIQNANELSTPPGAAEAFVGNSLSPAKLVQIQFLAELPKASPQEQQRREQLLNKIHLSGPAIPSASAAVGPSNPQTNVVNLPMAPGTFTLINNSALGAAAPSGYKSTINEPSVASNGSYVFYTGNFYAARSTNGGSTFSYVDPYADMPTFCCDQDVIYDKNRDMFIWYRQGIADANGVNFFRLGRSNNGGATWIFYDVYPTDINSSWTNQWWDYPQLALGNNYLYVASNMFNSNDFFTRTVLLRLSLDDLKAGGAVSYNYIHDSEHFTFAPVQGATTTMYWGTHHSNSVFRIFSWNENSTSFNWYDKTISAWDDTYRGSASCPGPDGYNWCYRTDDRVVSGWVANGTIGFFWNVKQGTNFPYPYVEAATFRESDKAYIGRPLIWNPNFAFQYGAASPDARGHLGIVIFWGGGSYYPNHAAGIDDDFNGDPVAEGWELYTTNTGTNGPSGLNWGDYIRVRPYYPYGLLYAATGYTLQGGTTENSVDPRYIVFGRERDVNNAPPNSPTPLTQFKSDGITGVQFGGATSETKVVLKGSISDPNSNNVQLEVEVQPVGTSFTNTSNCVSGATVLSGSIANSTCSGLIDGEQYHWQARAKDSTGAFSNWVSAGGNSESSLDFIVDTTPPTITLVSPTPANNSNLSQNWIFVNITANENLSVALLEWNGVNETMNQGSWYKNKTGLADGTYTFRVWGNDSAGNWGISGTRVVTIDTTPPLISITSPKNTTIADPTPLLNVTFGEVVNATWYRVDSGANSTIWKGVKNLTLELSSLSDAPHSITVWANDSLNNINTSMVWFTIDTIPPSITKISPPNITNDNTPLLNVSFGEIVNYTWYNIDGGANSTPFAETRNLTLDLPILADGPHNVTVYANDSAGNLNSTSVYFTIDTTSPTISFVNPTPVEKGSLGNLTIIITELYPATYKVYKNDSLVTTGSYANGVPINVSVDTSQITIWNYTIWANDTAGNSNFTSVFITVQDTIPPTITIHSPANATTNDDTPLLNATFGEVVNYTWYNINGSANSTTYTDTQNLTLILPELSDGQHNITVYANDSYGNLNSSTMYFTIDTTPPTIVIASPQNKTYATTNITLSVSADETVNTWMYSLNGTANVTFAPVTAVTVSEGANNITFWANDSVGNINFTTVYFTNDVTPPSVTNLTVTPGFPQIGNTVNITVNVTDATTSVEAVKANVTYPNGTTITLAMQPGSLYYRDDFDASVFGRYNVTIFANDSAGNIDSTVRTSFYTIITNNNATNVTNGSTASVLSISEHLDILVTANESLNATISLTALVSPTAEAFGIYEINSTTSPSQRPVKYINATNLTAIENITKITLRLYYNDSEISGLDEDSLTLLYWNGTNWLRVSDYVGSRIPGGPNVTAASLNKTGKHVFAELNRLSIYGLGGNVFVQQQQQAVSGGGGGGGGGGVVCILEGFQVLDLGLMGCIIKDLGLTAKLFFRISNTLASVFSMVGDVVGEWPAPRLDISSLVTRSIKTLEGDVYELAIDRVRKRWPSAPAVVIARGDLEVDSMAAVAYAKTRNYPILLTKPKELPSAVLAQAKSMDVKKIIIAGGPVAVSREVESQLASIALVERIHGGNREETAVELAKAMEQFKVIETIVVADGLNPSPEASIIAAGYRAPIVFTSGNSISQATKDFMAAHKVTKDAFKKKMKVVFVGVSDEARAEIESLMRS